MNRSPIVVPLLALLVAACSPDGGPQQMHGTLERDRIELRAEPTIPSSRSRRARATISPPARWSCASTMRDWRRARARGGAPRRSARPPRRAGARPAAEQITEARARLEGDENAVAIGSASSSERATWAQAAASSPHSASTSAGASTTPRWRAATRTARRSPR